MEIHSKKIESDVLHFSELSEGHTLEGWGISGVSKILKELVEGSYGYDYLNTDIVVAFYRHIQPRMLPGDEVRVDLAENDVFNIRFQHDGVLESYPNLFLYHES